LVFLFVSWVISSSKHIQRHEELERKIISKMSEHEPKNPFQDRDGLMGPLVNIREADKIEKLYNDAIEKGCTALLPLKRKGNYVWPTLIEVDKDRANDLMIFREELFGPIAILIKVDDADEAVDLANSTRFGLDAAVFGKDRGQLRRVARRLEVGAVFINEYPRHGIGYYPFGGMKYSGIGREGIGYSIKELTTTKTIVYNYKGYGIWEYI